MMMEDRGHVSSDGEDIANVGRPQSELVDDLLADDLELFDLSLKKKKKKKKKKDDLSEVSTSVATSTGERTWDGSDRDYGYIEMLDRIFRLLREKNPNLSERKRHSMPPPQMVRIGSRKTMWANISQMCDTLNRNMEHMISFFIAELGTEGSVDGNQRLVIKGRYLPKQIESLLKKYIKEYVECSMCKNPETTLSRDSLTRLYFIKCEMCGSSRSVAPIKSGFHATLRADRRAAKK